MKQKVIVFNANQNEIALFKQLNKYHFDLTIYQEDLNMQNIHLINGYDAIIVRTKSKINHEIANAIKQYQIKVLVTRTAGYDHLDLNALWSNDIKVAYVPNYGPESIAELAFSFALMSSRKSLYFFNKAHQNDFVFDQFGLSSLIHKKTVGIIGVGKIGYATAKMYQSIGCKVLGYDLNINSSYQQHVTYVDLKTIYEQADIISIHLPYIKNVNDQFINQTFFNQLKKKPIVINVARGLLQNEQDILQALKNNQIDSYLTDVLSFEEKLLKNQASKEQTKLYQELQSWYPRFCFSPHIGAYTNEAGSKMVELGLKNVYELLNDLSCDSQLIKK